MKKINVTYVCVIEDLGYDEEIGRNEAYEDGRFVVGGLPTKHHSAFGRKIKGIRGCERRPEEDCPRNDGRLRVNWNEFSGEDRRLKAKERILQVVKGFVPDSKVRYFELVDSYADEGYDPDDEVLSLLDGAFTEEEREYLPIEQRIGILGISNR